MEDTLSCRERSFRMHSYPGDAFLQEISPDADLRWMTANASSRIHGASSWKAPDISQDLIFSL